MRIEVNNQAALAALSRMQSAGANMRDFNQKLADDWSELVRSSFDTTSSPWGGGWAPLKEFTISRRRKGSATPLNDIGLLFGSIEAKGDASGAEVRVGRADRPAAVHQFGNPANRVFGRGLGPIPARPFLPITRGGQVRFAGTEYQDILDLNVKSFLDRVTQ